MRRVLEFLWPWAKIARLEEEMADLWLEKELINIERMMMHRQIVGIMRVRNSVN
jgi:hypothetical protein